MFPVHIFPPLRHCSPPHTHVFHLHGLPDCIISDWLSQFISRFWQEFGRCSIYWQCISMHQPPTAPKLMASQKERAARRTTCAMFHRLPPKGLGLTDSTHGICIQQCRPCVYQDEPVICQLWFPRLFLAHTAHSPHSPCSLRPDSSNPRNTGRVGTNPRGGQGSVQTPY